MKKLIIFLTILISLSVPAITTENQTSQTAPKLTEAEKTAFLDGITGSLSEHFITNMAAELCGIVQDTQTVRGYHGDEALERNLLRYAELSRNDPKYKQKIAAFWNYYADRMICQAANGFYPKQHLYSRALELGVHLSVLEEYFFHDPISFPIDVNAVEILPSGRVTTVIDYIDAALAMEEAEDRYNVEQVEDLRGYLVKKFGAKIAGEMNPTELARRTAHAKKFNTAYQSRADKK